MNTQTKTFKLNHTAIAYSIATIAVSFAVTLGFVVAATDGDLSDSSSRSGDPVPTTVQTCATEDSDNCIWLSSEHDSTSPSFIRLNSIRYVDSAVLVKSQSCAEQLEAWTEDATSLLSDIAGQWAMGGTFGEYVISDNLQPMNDRLTYLTETYCR